MKKVRSLTFKTFLGHLILFSLLCGCYFLMINKSVKVFVTYKFKKEIEHWIKDITKARNVASMVALAEVKATPDRYLMQVIDQDHQLLFDSSWTQKHKKASPTWGTPLSKLEHIRLPFRYQDQTYAIKVIFDHRTIPLSIIDIRKIYIFVGAFFSLIFIILSLTMMVFVSKPFNRLFRAVNDYYQGKITTLPEVDQNGTSEATVFAGALNHLTKEVEDLKAQLKIEQQRASAIIDSLSEGVITVDHDLQITYANLKGAKLLGAPKIQIVGQQLSNVKPKRNTQVLLKCQELARAAVQNHALLTDSIVIGEENKVHLDILVVPIGVQKGVAIILQDNSTHHKILTLGKEFIANASHELRTPITIIKGFAEMLHDLPEISESMLEDITDKIMRNCHRMSALVKNLLVLADLDNLPQTCLEERDVSIILEDCRHQLQVIHPEVDIHLKVKQEPLLVNVDPSLIELGLMNLLENAVKYSPSPAKIEIQAFEKDDDILIEVTDSGIGIPEKDLQHIFDRFYTVDKAHSRKLGGAGLGLSIVRSIIEKLEGSLDVNSAFGTGTTFVVTLPKAKSLVTS